MNNRIIFPFAYLYIYIIYIMDTGELLQNEPVT